MAYIPPDGDKVDFLFQDNYTPPEGDAADFDFGEEAIPPRPGFTSFQNPGGV